MTGLSKSLLILAAVFVCATPSFTQDVSKEAQRYMIRGEAAMEEAENPTDYKDAVIEFKKATELAPKWAEAWFNLGVAQEAVKDFSGAMNSFKMYLKLKPDADDKDKIKTHIIRLEYKRDKAEKAKIVQKEKFLRNLSGTWQKCTVRYGCRKSGSNSKIKIQGNLFELKEFRSDGSRGIGMITFRGTIRGLNITGTVEIDWKAGIRKGRVLRGLFNGKINNQGTSIVVKYDYIDAFFTINKRDVVTLKGLRPWRKEEAEFRKVN